MPATGAALTVPYARRSTATVVDFLDQVERWLDPTAERVYAILAKLSAHRAPDVLLWALAHPRWACVCHPTDAASLTLIEPWWKILRSLALQGRRCETWAEVCHAAAAAAAYGNAHRHPFHWRSRRHRHAARPPGIASLPAPA